MPWTRWPRERERPKHRRQRSSATSPRRSHFEHHFERSPRNGHARFPFADAEARSPRWSLISASCKENWQARALPGDAERGKKIFSGKGQCSTCHTISGEGGFIGPDLSAYGSALSAEAILKAILNPVRIAPPGYKSAAVTTADGTRVEGVVRNEDNFSVQLQQTDGSFHFFQKSEVRSVEYLDHSLMPTNYREQLSASELNDLPAIS